MSQGPPCPSWLFPKFTGQTGQCLSDEDWARLRAAAGRDRPLCRQAPSGSQASGRCQRRCGLHSRGRACQHALPAKPAAGRDVLIFKYRLSIKKYMQIFSKKRSEMKPRARGELAFKGVSFPNRPAWLLFTQMQDGTRAAAVCDTDCIGCQPVPRQAEPPPRAVPLPGRWDHRSCPLPRVPAWQHQRTQGWAGSVGQAPLGGGGRGCGEGGSARLWGLSPPCLPPLLSSGLSCLMTPRAWRLMPLSAWTPVPA